jgi:hypothetical protein
MSYSFSYTESSTFTVTHARHMAAKVATDLKRMQRFYGSPSDESIASYEAEATEMIRAGYLGAPARSRAVYRNVGSIQLPSFLKP